MILLILVVVWAAVLGTSLLRRRLERRSDDSIGAFHRQLRVLGRAGPSPGRPAFHLATAVPDAVAGAGVPSVSPGAGLGLLGAPVVTGAPVRLRTARAPVAGAERGVGPAGAFADTAVLLHPVEVPAAAPDAPRPSAGRGLRSAKRRRDVLLCLVAAVFGSGILGAVPTLRFLLAVTVLAAVSTALYVALLVRRHARAVERAAKLRYLPVRADRDATVVVRRSASL